MRLDYKKTFLIGFGFFAASLAWALYNSFVPLMLEDYLDTWTINILGATFVLGQTTLIGVIMTFDNIFGVIFQPLMGQVSDRTRSRFGRRMPYILIGVPICAVFFALIPWATNLVMLMSFIICFNLVMSTWRSPVVALMPDLTPPALRSKANGVINLMGGIGGIIALLGGGYLVKMTGGNQMPFLMVSIVMLLAAITMFFFVKESDNRRLTKQTERLETGMAMDEIAAAKTAKESIRRLTRPEKRSLIFILLAIFFWFTGFNAVEAFFTLFATNKMQVSDGDASISLALFSLALVIFALPSGIIAGHVGRKKMIVIGLLGTIAVFIPMIFILDLLLMRILLFVGGLFWACININSLPMVVELAAPERIGSYTGYYYFFSFSAAIVSPILFGVIRDITQDYATLFVYSIVAFILALICMSFVKHGEASKDVPAVIDEPAAETV